MDFSKKLDFFPEYISGFPVTLIFSLKMIDFLSFAWPSEIVILLIQFLPLRPDFILAKITENFCEADLWGETSNIILFS